LGLVTFPAALDFDVAVATFAGEDLGLIVEALAGEGLAGDNLAGDLIGDFPGLLNAVGVPLGQTGLDMVSINCRSEVEVKERLRVSFEDRFEMNKKIDCDEEEKEKENGNYFSTLLFTNWHQHSLKLKNKIDRTYVIAHS
jgi:hypothetical protein